MNEEASNHLQEHWENYTVLRTKGSDVDGITVDIQEFYLPASNPEHAVKRYVEEYEEDLVPEKIEEADCMEKQHYFAVKRENLEEFGHPENTGVHPILGR